MIWLEGEHLGQTRVWAGIVAAGDGEGKTTPGEVGTAPFCDGTCCCGGGDDKDAGSPGDDRICKRLGDSVMVGSCCGCGCRCNMFVHGELVPPDPMTDTGC